VSPTDRAAPGTSGGRGRPAAEGAPASPASTTFLHPAGWARPKGYAYGVVAEGRMVVLSGLIGWDARGRLVAGGFVAQARQALTNVATLLAEARATPAHVVRMTWYVVDKREYLDAQEGLGRVYRDIIGRHYPSMTVVQVADLLEPGARVEIEVTAVVPPRRRRTRVIAPP